MVRYFRTVYHTSERTRVSHSVSLEGALKAATIKMFTEGITEVFIYNDKSGPSEKPCANLSMTRNRYGQELKTYIPRPAPWRK
jgi:hypothetical protein